MVLLEVIGDLLPKGVLNVVSGFGLEAGKPLASSNRIAKIAFTGETTTGRLIMQYASQNLIPVTLELGGKSPNIFFDDVGAKDDDFFRQGDRRLCRNVCAQPGRGLHLPKPRAHPAVARRPLHGARAQARRRYRAGQPTRSSDDDRRAGFLRADGEDPVLLRHRQEGGRRRSYRRRAQRARRPICGRLLYQADRVQGPQQDAHLPGGDLRPGRVGDHIQDRRGSALDRQRHPLRPRRRHMEPRRQSLLPLRARDPGGPRVDQLLPRLSPRMRRSAATSNRASAAKTTR